MRRVREGERGERGRQRGEGKNALPWLAKKETASLVGVYTNQGRELPDS